RWPLVAALGGLGLPIWLGRGPRFARTAMPTPLDTPPRAAAPAPAAAAAGAAPVRVPVVFLPNAGQADPSVRFVAPGARGTLWFTDEGVVLGLRADPPAPREKGPARARVSAEEERIAATSVESAGGAAVRLR